MVEKTQSSASWLEVRLYSRTGSRLLASSLWNYQVRTIHSSIPARVCLSINSCRVLYITAFSRNWGWLHSGDWPCRSTVPLQTKRCLSSEVLLDASSLSFHQFLINIYGKWVSIPKKVLPLNQKALWRVIPNTASTQEQSNSFEEWERPKRRAGVKRKPTLAGFVKSPLRPNDLTVANQVKSFTLLSSLLLIITLTFEVFLYEHNSTPDYVIYRPDVDIVCPIIPIISINCWLIFHWLNWPRLQELYIL